MTMTEYQREQADERAALETLGADVAAELAAQGFGAYVAHREADHWGADLTCGDARLFLSFDRAAPSAKRRDRVVIYGAFPHGTTDRYRYGSESDHQRRQVRRWEITVAVSRGVPVIAREIGRRLLSAGYMADLRAVIGWQEEHDAYTRNALTTAQELAKLIGSAASVNERDAAQPEVRWHPKGDGYGTFRVSPGSVYVERCSIPVDLFRRIAAVLADQP